MNELTGQQIIDLFNSLIDDSIDNDTALILANDAKTELEGERNWACLKKKDPAVQYSRPGDTYATAKNLPDDFSNTLKIVLDNYRENLKGINFDEQEEFKDQFGFYFLDINGNKLYLTGAPDQERKITHFYKCTSPFITLSTSWQYFPGRFHPLIAYKMAAKFYNIDFSDISAQAGADRMWLRNASILQSSLNNWDDMLKLKANQSREGWNGYNDPSRI